MNPTNYQEEVRKCATALRAFYEIEYAGTPRLEYARGLADIDLLRLYGKDIPLAEFLALMSENQFTIFPLVDSGNNYAARQESAREFLREEITNSESTKAMLQGYRRELKIDVAPLVNPVLEATKGVAIDFPELIVETEPLLYVKKDERKYLLARMQLQTSLFGRKEGRPLVAAETKTPYRVLALYKPPMEVAGTIAELTLSLASVVKRTFVEDGQIQVPPQERMLYPFAGIEEYKKFARKDLETILI